MLATTFSENLLAIAALFTAFIGGIATIWQVVQSKREKSAAAMAAKGKAEDECHDRLLKAHREAEEISTELHEIRMRRENGS